MAEVNQMGQPTRSAVKDANEGNINPPSIKRQAEQYATVQKNISTLSVGTKSLGNSLGNALVQGMSREAQEINNRREVEAVARQGNESAINSIDKSKERTGWTKAIFGQNIEYRVAQQRAATNGVNDLYLNELNTLDKSAGDNPEQYADKLTQSLNNTLEKYEGDKDTQNLVKARWLEHSKKLAAKHYESHYAYNQQQQRETYQTEVEQTFDAANLESNLITSSEDATEVQNKVYDMLAGKGRPEGMADEAHRLAISEVIQKNLRQGNVGAYNAAKTYGWFDDNTEKEQIALERALSDYGTYYKSQVDNTWAEAELQVFENKTYEGMFAIYENLKGQLETLGKRSSGTPEAESALAKTKLKAAKGVQDVIQNRMKVTDELDKFFNEGMEATRKEEAKAAQLEELKTAVNTTQSIDRAGKISTLGATPKEQGEALDLVLLDDLARLTGSPEPLTPLDGTRLILGDSNLTKQVRQKVQGKQIKSPMIKQAVTTVINGLNGLVDETGKINEVGKQALNSISILEQDEDNFINTVGVETYDKLQIIQSELPQGATIEMVQKKLDKYEINKGDRERIGSKWRLNEDESKQDRISKLYNNATKQYPSSHTVAHYMKAYDRGLVIYDEDHERAEDYLYRTIMNEGVQHRGMVIQNGKSVVKGLEYGLSELLDYAQEGSEVSGLTTHLKTLGAVDDKGKPVTRLDQIPGISFTVIGEELYIDSDTAQGEVVIRRNHFEAWAKGLQEKKRLDQMRKEADDKSFMEYIKLKQQLGDYKPTI